MKAMKTKMLILVFLLGITDLFAQTLYVPGTIVKGKNASYYCSTEYEILIKVNNVNNVDTTTTMYYDDGTVVPHYVGLGGTIATIFSISKYEILLFRISISSCVNTS